MLKAVKNQSLENLIEETVPNTIFLDNKNKKSQNDILGPPISERTALRYLKSLAEKNKIYKNYIGCGYNPVIVPSVVLRNILESPAWYTSYTPYQVNTFIYY
jgi:glycine dehydrogenase